MTKKELIDALEGLSDTASVMIWDNECNEWRPIERINFDIEYNKIEITPYFNYEDHRYKNDDIENDPPKLTKFLST